MSKDEFFNIVNMSTTITEQIGYSLYRDEYYSDVYYGKEYKYDDLTITYYDNHSIYIYIGNNEVLKYDYTNKKGTYTDGKWTNLIGLIYDEIPNILLERKIEAEMKRNKKAELKSLEEYFKYYIDVEKNKPEVLEVINEQLEKKDIKVIKRVGYTYLTNLCTGDEMPQPYTYFKVSYKNNDVAQFMGNVFDPYPNMDNCIENYRQGEWTNEFKKTIIKAKETDKLLTRQNIDNKAEKAIDQFMKTFKKNY